MGCARSKSKKKDDEPKDANQQQQTESTEPNKISTRPQSEVIVLDDVKKQTEGGTQPIETVYVHQDDSGGTTSVLRTTYQQNKNFSPEETINLLKDEAYDILRKALRKPATLEDAVRLVQSSCALSQVNTDLLRHAVCLIRSEKISGMAQMIEQLMKVGDKSFSRQEAEDCVRALFIFSEDRAAKNSLLRVIHEKLEKGQSLPKSDNRQVVCTPLDSLQLDASEHENVEVTVKKSVRQRSINLKDLEQRGLKAEDVIGKEVYIVSTAPEGLDENIRLKAEELMHAAGSIYNPINIETIDASDDSTNFDATNEIRKIMEAHKRFSSSLEKRCTEDVMMTDHRSSEPPKFDSNGIQC